MDIIKVLGQNKDILEKIKNAKTSSDLVEILDMEFGESVNSMFSSADYPVFKVQEDRLDSVSAGIGSLGVFGTNFCTHCSNCTFSCA